MTNGELFKKENPTIETKINGSCVWIYYFDGVNHYTIPTEWWNKEIGVFDKIRAEIDQKQYDYMSDGDYDEGIRFALMLAYQIINRHIREDGE